jgi:hypothetical protein
MIDSEVPQGLIRRFVRRMAAGGLWPQFRTNTCRLAGSLALAVSKSDYASPEKYILVIDWVKEFIERTLPKVIWPAWLAWITLVPMSMQQQIVFFILKGAIDAAIEGALGLIKQQETK